MPADGLIDLRSDTVTRPSSKMRRAMAEAEVGDDVYREDPTVNRLEQRAAELFGKEAALLVPTGTMGNTIALKMHTQHGEEVVCEAHSHILDWELSMLAWFSGCLVRPVASENGVLTWKEIEPALRKFGPHNAPTTAISLENTHNTRGGTVYPLEVIDDICAQAHGRKLKVHMDGARIFNASVASGVPVSRIARDVDSVMFCLSKGLGAPVGSMVVGRREAIERARLYRKRLGGGMRQAGVLAAAGLVALEESPALLAQDHENARYLADALAQIPNVAIDPHVIQTNIVIFDISRLGLSTAEFSSELRSQGLLANGIADNRMRLVTHLDVSRADCVRAAEILARVATKITAVALSV
jgi:threonine aldolase